MKTSNTKNGAHDLSCTCPVYSAPEINVYELSVEGILCASGTEDVGNDYGSWN